MSMERRMSRESKGSLGMQKKIVAETRARRRTEHVRDLTDFMNDMFFGTADMEKKTYDLTGGTGRGIRGGRGYVVDVDEDYGFDDSTRSNSGRLTQGWLEEARQVLASSPARSRSPGRLVGSPRFAASQGRSPLVSLDRRDALSRSARRNKAAESLGEEILSKSAKHTRNNSDTFTPPSPSPSPSPSHSPSSSPSHSHHHGHGSPATPLHMYFSSSNHNNPPPSPRPRKSRFQAQTQPNNSPHTAQTPPRRSFPHSLPLSPPRNPFQSSHRRSRSSSTCSLDNIADPIGNGTLDRSLNGFLKHQRTLLFKILNRELPNAKVTIVLSGNTNSAPSMVAAVCHAWLLSYRRREEGTAAAVVPVMNVRRGAMWKLRQAAWLFHHAGLDAAALLFSDEVDLEKLMMTGQLSVLVVGQDILCTTGEVGSQCTILTDNFCEDAYDLLQNPLLKKLLLAGILLDTRNLKASASITMTRDAEAVRLLLVGLAPNYRYTLFDQLMHDQKASSFVEVLNHNYGRPPDEGEKGEGNTVHKIGERKSTSNYETMFSSPKKNHIDSNVAKTNKIPPKSAKLISPPLPSPSPVVAHAEKEASRGKNKFFLAKWFGFGS